MRTVRVVRVARALPRGRRPRARRASRLLAPRLLLAPLACRARIPADELRAPDLELRVLVETGPRDLFAEKRGTPAPRVAVRLRAVQRAHARRRVVGRKRQQPLEPVVPLAKRTDDEAEDRPERAQPLQHGPVVARLCVAEARVDPARIALALGLDAGSACVHRAPVAVEH